MISIYYDGDNNDSLLLIASAQSKAGTKESKARL